jgi:hypothetical protein
LQRSGANQTGAVEQERLGVQQPIQYMILSCHDSVSSRHLSARTQSRIELRCCSNYPECSRRVDGASMHEWTRIVFGHPTAIVLNRT